MAKSAGSGEGLDDPVFPDFEGPADGTSVQMAEPPLALSRLIVFSSEGSFVLAYAAGVGNVCNVLNSVLKYT